jgi:hypothetical protein
MVSKALKALKFRQVNFGSSRVESEHSQAESEL